VQVAVAGGDRQSGLGGQLPDRCIVTEPPQDQRRLRADRARAPRRPATPRSPRNGSTVDGPGRNSSGLRGCKVGGAENLSLLGMSSAVRCRTSGAFAPKPLRSGDRPHIRITMIAPQSFSTRPATPKPWRRPRITTAAHGMAAGCPQHSSPTGAGR
jgi:hypothetical protein